MNVGLSQRYAARTPIGSTWTSSALYVLRNFTAGPGRYTDEFQVSALDAIGNVIPNTTTTSLTHGRTLMLPAGQILVVRITQTSGNAQGTSTTLSLQPYDIVIPEYDIFHFFHEEGDQVTWAIGSRASDPNTVCVLRSTDYFNSAQEMWSIYVASDDVNYGQYRSIYVDAFKNIILGWRPGPLISRDGGATFEPLPFHWMDPFHGLLCPFWNITEDEAGTMVISEYGDSLSTTEPRGSHRGTFWSTDPGRTAWQLKVVGAGFGPSIADINSPSGYIRHIHGYHINPYFPNVHHMFLGDPPISGGAGPACGYYVSQDAGQTWSTSILVEWANSHDPGFFYNGPCFISWWPSGEAFITCDSAATGHAFWWGSGPSDWGGPAFNPAILLNSVDEESVWPCTPWMAMIVSDAEAYCATSSSVTSTSSATKEIVWRYDRLTGSWVVLAETFADLNFYKTLKWLSGSRHNRIPTTARYFFTSGNRRFPRLSPRRVLEVTA